MRLELRNAKEEKQKTKESELKKCLQIRKKGLGWIPESEHGRQAWRRVWWRW